MKTSKEGIKLLKDFEGYRRDIYIDAAGNKTIGYGHKITDEKHIDTSDDSLEYIFLEDLKEVEESINNLEIDFSQCQFDAVVSLIFNVGIGSFRKSKTYSALKKGDIPTAINEWNDFNKIKGEINTGLVERRKKELDFFLKRGYNKNILTMKKSMKTTKKWYESKAVWGGIISIISVVAGAFGYYASEEQMQELILAGTAIGTSLGGVISVVGRVKAEKKID